MSPRHHLVYKCQSLRRHSPVSWRDLTNSARIIISDIDWVLGVRQPTSGYTTWAKPHADTGADYPFTEGEAPGYRAEHFHLLSRASFTQDLGISPAASVISRDPSKGMEGPPKALSPRPGCDLESYLSHFLSSETPSLPFPSRPLIFSS